MNTGVLIRAVPPEELQVNQTVENTVVGSDSTLKYPPDRKLVDSEEGIDQPRLDPLEEEACGMEPHL